MVLESQWSLDLVISTTPLYVLLLSSIAIIAKPPRSKSRFSANANSLGLEDGASSQSKNIISELRSVHDLARVDRFVLPNLI